jgi:hypothetical protein
MNEHPIRTRCIGLAALLGLSLLGNAFQVLWSMDGDSVTRMSRPDLEARIRQLRVTHQGSAAWVQALVDTPDAVVVEACSLIHFRGLFGNHVKRDLYIWTAGR